MDAQAAWHRHVITADRNAMACVSRRQSAWEGAVPAGDVHANAAPPVFRQSEAGLVAWGRRARGGRAKGRNLCSSKDVRHALVRRGAEKSVGEVVGFAMTSDASDIVLLQARGRTAPRSKARICKDRGESPDEVGYLSRARLSAGTWPDDKTDARRRSDALLTCGQADDQFNKSDARLI